MPRILSYDDPRITPALDYNSPRLLATLGIGQGGSEQDRLLLGMQDQMERRNARLDDEVFRDTQARRAWDTELYGRRRSEAAAEEEAIRYAEAPERAARGRALDLQATGDARAQQEQRALGEAVARNAAALERMAESGVSPQLIGRMRPFIEAGHDVMEVAKQFAAQDQSSQAALAKWQQQEDTRRYRDERLNIERKKIEAGRPASAEGGVAAAREWATVASEIGKRLAANEAKLRSKALAGPADRQAIIVESQRLLELLELAQKHRSAARRGDAVPFPDEVKDFGGGESLGISSRRGSPGYQVAEALVAAKKLPEALKAAVAIGLDAALDETSAGGAAVTRGELLEISRGDAALASMLETVLGGVVEEAKAAGTPARGAGPTTRPAGSDGNLPTSLSAPAPGMRKQGPDGQMYERRHDGLWYPI
jgi:hypothetical protein